MSKKTKKSLAAPTQEPKEFETKIGASKEEFATSLTPVADAEKKEDTAEEKKEETPKSEPAAPEEKKDSVPEKAEQAPDKEKSETETEDVPAKDKVKNDEKAEVKEDKKSEGAKKVAKPAKKGGSNVILGVSFAVMVAAVGVMGMTMVQNKNADKSSIPAVGGSFSVTGNVAEDTSFTEQAAVAPSTALTSDGRRWAMGASNVLIQAEDGTGAVVPVDAAETFQYDGKSLSFEKDGATYIVRMVAIPIPVLPSTQRSRPMRVSRSRVCASPETVRCWSWSVLVLPVTRKAMQLYALLLLICSKRLCPHRGPVTSRSMVLP